MERILLVDDEAGILDVLADILAMEGYETETASSGEDALARLRARAPHLMLLDIRMPGMGGIEVLEEAKKILPELGVIMVTAVHDERIARRAMELGAFDYVTKPINLEFLKSAIRVRLAQAGGNGG